MDRYGWKSGIIQQRLVESFVISFILFLKWGNWAEKVLLILMQHFHRLFHKACVCASMFSLSMNALPSWLLWRERKPDVGRAIAQAVSRRLSTAAARVRTRICSSGICAGQNGPGAGSLRVLRFPLPIFIPPNSPSSQSPGAGTIGQKWPTCRVDPVRTPPPPPQLAN
jgi:hypothetical protein